MTRFRSPAAAVSGIASGTWSSGMILALGARGREFDSRSAPSRLNFVCFCVPSPPPHLFPGLSLERVTLHVLKCAPLLASGSQGTLHSDFVQTSIIVSLAFPSLPCILVSFHHPLLSPNSLPTNPHETNPNPFIEDTLLCLYSLGFETFKLPHLPHGNQTTYINTCAFCYSNSYIQILSTLQNKATSCALIIAQLQKKQLLFFYSNNKKIGL